MQHVVVRMFDVKRQLVAFLLMMTAVVGWAAPTPGAPGGGGDFFGIGAAGVGGSAHPRSLDTLMTHFLIWQLDQWRNAAPANSAHRARAAVLVQQAEQDWRRGGWRAANSGAMTAMADDPANVRGYMLLATIWNSLSLTHPARQALVRVRELAPFSKEADLAAQQLIQGSFLATRPDDRDLLLWGCVDCGPNRQAITDFIGLQLEADHGNRAAIIRMGYLYYVDGERVQNLLEYYLRLTASGVGGGKRHAPAIPLPKGEGCAAVVHKGMYWTVLVPEEVTRGSDDSAKEAELLSRAPIADMYIKSLPPAPLRAELAASDSPLGRALAMGVADSKMNVAGYTSLLRQASQAGDMTATMLLGLAKFTGCGEKPDPAGAIGVFTRAAKGGALPAAILLGDAYQVGAGVAADPLLARQWYAQAATAGLRPAEQDMAAMLSSGAGGAKDLPGAVRWSRLAAAQGDASAATQLAYAYQYGLGVAADVAQAAFWASLALQIDRSPKAATILGHLYHYGQGVTRDDAHALTLFKQAAAGDDVQGLLALGLMHFYGYATPVDIKLAKNRLYLATKGGSATARGILLLLGFDSTESGEDHDWTGLGAISSGGKVKQDYREALHWLSDSAAHGDDDAMTFLAGIYELGLGVPADHAQALTWYRKAAEMGNPEAIRVLAASH